MTACLSNQVELFSSSDFRIWFGNLAKYNEGKLVGKWLALPMDEDALNKEIKDVLGDDEEYFLADWECPLSIVSEHSCPFKLNEIASELEEISDHDMAILDFLIDEERKDYQEAVECMENVIFYEGMNMEDVAINQVDDGLWGKVDERLKSHLDYDSIARDLGYSGAYTETKAGVFEYIH